MAVIHIVDDDIALLRTLTTALENDGHYVLQDRNGAEALQRLGVEPEREAALPGVIILDVMMPVMDGYTVASRLFADPRTSSIPLILLTSKGQTKDMFAEFSNVARFLEKPVNLDSIRVTIKKVLTAEA